MTVETTELVARLQAALGPQYRIESELGRGGMGMVFLATDTTLDRPVAVKVMHPDLSIHPAIIQRFLAEARMIARLRHPNIVQVHAAGEATGLFYYVMDHVPGETLRQRLNRDGKLAPDEVIRIVGDMADALGAAGRAGLVHRDVKPENILLDSSTGRALLADFGIARVAAAETSGQLTGQGVAVGTPSYMSPEQATGEPVDHRSDLYSLGVVAYEMLAGFPPFRGPNGAAVISMQLSEQPVPIERVRSEVPSALAAAVMRALEKTPDDRWQDGDEFRRALREEVNRKLRRRRPPIATVLTAAAVLIGATTLALALGGRDGPPKGVNPRHSMLILPFNNLRDDQGVEWLREGSVNMLSLNLAQWNDLSVVDHEYLHDLLAKREVRIADAIGLDLARRLARDAGVWTVVLGDFDRSGDSLHLVARVYDVATGGRVSVAQVDGLAQTDVRVLFDQLAAKLLDLSGAPGELRADLARMTTSSLEAYRAYLRGIDQLNQWDLNGAERELRAAIAEDSTFGLAYYKLALTRGWMVGADDSLGMAAIQAATRFSDRLPEHDRTVIKAYRAFVDGDNASARGLYQTLLRRDSSDADAWYGLADAAFHDTTQAQRARNWTESLRAFDRVLRLDPTYTLAYEHILQMLTWASYQKPSANVALVIPDSFAFFVTPDGRQVMDSAQLATAVALARTQAAARGREWVAQQPETLRSHERLIGALMAGGDFNAALSELRRVRTTAEGGGRPDLALLEGRIHFAAGDIEQAAETYQVLLDTVQVDDFVGAPFMSHTEAAVAAGAFAYLGQLDRATRAVRFADSVRVVVHPNMRLMSKDPLRSELASLYAGTGVPEEEMRKLWAQTAEAARVAPSTDRGDIALSGAAAALGLFVGPASDPSALQELQAFLRTPLPGPLRALLALHDANQDEARRILSQPDTASNANQKYSLRVDDRPFAAQAWFLLGDYQKTIDLLRDFQPTRLSTDGFDSRWAMLGRIRLLRAYAYEKLGQRAAAAAEFRAVLAQWKNADPTLAPYRRQAEEGLTRTTGVG